MLVLFSSRLKNNFKYTMEYMEEGDIAERRSEGVDYILDENSACVVNVKSIRNRLGAMDAEEAQYAQDISAQLVTHIIRLAHCSESNKIKDTIASIAGLFINNIFDNNSTKNKLKRIINSRQSHKTSLAFSISLAL